MERDAVARRRLTGVEIAPGIRRAMQRVGIVLEVNANVMPGCDVVDSPGTG